MVVLAFIRVIVVYLSHMLPDCGCYFAEKYALALDLMTTGLPRVARLARLLEACTDIS